VGTAEGAVVGVGKLGGDVIVPGSSVAVALGIADVSSLHPQNRPGVRHEVLVTLGVVTLGVVKVVVVVVLVVVLSLHPNQPLLKVRKMHAQFPAAPLTG
jgi:hypothetical protein